ncbi:hypothetical protein [Candidatus Methanomassiliicoccus intestinalis]|uniref:hypothetical protein n=1 Tax=Candidatus Methanomassiliicoccus intestinalis TaxID=1406512 RepID=UPI0037DD1158
MDAKKISCVVVALMFLSVGCFAALGPNGSEDATGDAPMLATESENDLMSIEAMETTEFLTILMPVYDVETGTFSATDFEEVRIYAQPATSEVANGGGVNKIEKFRYYAQTSSLGFTEHYDGYKIYLSNDALTLILNGSFLVADIVGGGVPSAVIAIVETAITTLGGIALNDVYPNGMIFVVATGIYITHSTTIPLVTLLHTESQ